MVLKTAVEEFLLYAVAMKGKKKSTIGTKKVSIKAFNIQ